MGNMQEVMAVGENCPDFTRENSFEESSLKGAKSCELCFHWDHNRSRCRIDMYDKVLTGLDQT